MSWLEQTIAEFGQSLGIPGLIPDDRGLVQFRFGDGGILCLELVEEELLVYMSAEVSAHDHATKLRALTLCQHERQWPVPVQAGIRNGDQLVFLVRLASRAVSLTALEQAIDLLRRLHGMARG